MAWSNIILTPTQQEALESLNKNPHTLFIAPTGSGKSLVFQRYVLSRKKQVRALFISPLVALGRQHAKRFQELGILTSPRGPGVWILNPESLREKMGPAHRHLSQWKPNFLIVDEAHCISEWGAEFRPEFKKILTLVRDYQIPKSFWCTATLPKSAKNEILQSLTPAPYVIGKFSLPPQINIKRVNTSPAIKLDFLRRLIKEHTKDYGIIFASTRQSTERIAGHLRYWGFSPLIYHAGLSLEERLALEKKLEKAKQSPESCDPLIVVATSAFGMGMDYPFLKFCVLYEPPLTLLALAQAMGRVGRNSNDSVIAYALWSQDDFLRLKWFTHGKEKQIQELDLVRQWYQSLDYRIEFEKYFQG